MTPHKHTKKFAAVALLAALAAVTALSATTASAATTATCPTRTAKQAFSRYGDANKYFLAPNGGFESGTTSWAYGGSASVVSENESAYLNSTADRKSLKLSSGAWVRTGLICIDSTEQILRLMVKGTSGQLKVDAKIVSGGNIRTWSTQVDAGSAGWRPSPQIAYSQGANQYLGATTLELTFTAIGSTWQIDDVFIDPWKGF